MWDFPEYCFSGLGQLQDIFSNLDMGDLWVKLDISFGKFEYSIIYCHFWDSVFCNLEIFTLYGIFGRFIG